MNRVMLLLVALILAAAGAAAVALAVRPSWMTGPMDQAVGGARDGISSLQGWTTAMPGVGTFPVAALIVMAVALLLLILLIIFIATRGGGRTATVLRERANDGLTEVDRGVADDMLAGNLRSVPDVVSAHTGVFEVKGAPAIVMTVAVRQGAQLPRILDAAEQAVAEWDVLVGKRIPVLLHLAGRGWLDRWRSATRVQ